MRALVKQLDELLLPLGFRRTKRVWNRASGLYVDVVELQVSKSRDSMTVNLGVLDPEIYRQCWNEDAPRNVQAPHCTVRARLGELIDGKDTWWSIGCPEIIHAITAYGLPFLDRMHEHSAMEEHLQATEVAGRRYPDPASVIYLALLMNKRGDRAGACALIRQQLEKGRGAWQARFREIAERLGCL